jgi:tRNA U38,U39,U40 pseudouridine synthase TruA
VRIALGLEYDGAAFTGWQTQPDGRAAQDALERALAAIAGTPIATICAGRTDTGVHAIDQVVHFDTAVTRPLGAWVRGVNRYLPHAMAVRWARPVPDAFHARFGAVSRTYDYWILNDPVRPALAHARVGKRAGARALFVFGQRAQHDARCARGRTCGLGARRGLHRRDRSGRRGNRRFSRRRGIAGKASLGLLLDHHLLGAAVTETLAHDAGLCARFQRQSFRTDAQRFVARIFRISHSTVPISFVARMPAVPAML